ncbi:Elongator protein 3/MiaB/NifB domain protein, partial [Candidatus Magnetomorum sp. HK-1]
MIFWGCPNNCTFCINRAYRKIYGKNSGKFLRSYSVNRIIKELSYLVNKWNITLFHFHDEDFCLKPITYFKKLVEKYKAEVNTPFVCMANAKNITPQKVKLLKDMGCVSISIGIETGNDHLRKNILKRNENKEDIIRAVHLLNDAGIRTSSFNMLGIPFETRSTFMETVAINKESEIQYPNIVFFYPLENTELREISIKNNFLNNQSEARVPVLNFNLVVG